jgi:hypothetical protein
MQIVADVDAWFSEGSTDDTMALRIGWDRNRDRSLAGEAAVTLGRPVSLSARFHGVAATGALLMEGSVQPQRAVLPVAGFSNERASLLAVVERGNKAVAQTDLPIVIDRQPPQIIKTEVENGNRCLAGAPATVQVEASDGELSGIAGVQAAWALDGRMQLTDDMKPLPAVLRSDGRWMLTLPTATLPPGDNTLLIAALDKAGNRSETYLLNVRLHSQAELDELAAAATSNISGTLMFAKVPQSGLRIELFEAPLDEKSSAAGKDKEAAVEAEPRCVATATTQADGSFRLNTIRTGSYVMRVTGIVRGMKLERTRPISVSAPKQVAPIMWRLDTQP